MLMTDTESMVLDAAIKCVGDAFPMDDRFLDDRLLEVAKTTPHDDIHEAMLILDNVLKGKNCILRSNVGAKWLRIATVAEAIESASNPSGMIHVEIDGELIEAFVEA